MKINKRKPNNHLMYRLYPINVIQIKFEDKLFRQMNLNVLKVMYLARLKDIILENVNTLLKW